MHRKSFLAALGAVVMVAFSATAFAQAGQNLAPVKVIKAARFARTQPLRDMRYPNLPPVLRRVIGNRTLSPQQIAQLREKLVKSGLLHSRGQGVVVPLLRKQPALSTLRRAKDPVVQTKLPRTSNVATTPGLGFDGLGVSTGTSPGFTPPDTNAAVGQNDIVEAVNVEFAVYSKSSGNLLFGPMNITNLWTSLGGICLTGGTSDPIVNYDRLAQRWVISQITVSGTAGNYHCVAVSQSGDPTGAYYTYAFQVIGGSGIPDYPKLGVWPDAYYATFNDFTSGFNGVDFVAYDRAAMIAGNPNAQMIEFGPVPTAYSDLPVTFDGTTATLPPSGAPGLFVNYISPNISGGSAYGLELWSMHVDWTTPANSTLTDNGMLTVDPFTDLVCGGARTCIPQATSAQTLDAISDRLMNRAVYRNFGGHQAIVAMHNVGSTTSGSPPAGERWYELRAPSGSASGSAYAVYQQSTFAPSDGNSRWMGSIAFDHSGDIAMGYSLSGPTQDPEIAYTGRQAGDPLGQMSEPETVLQAAGGADTGTYARWGDYTSMQIDPTDDCTFWYTNEYYATPGDSFSWSTHLGSFKFGNCFIGPHGTVTGTVTAAASGSAIAGAKVTMLPGNVVVTTGTQGLYSVTLAPATYTATAVAFGYNPNTATVTVTTGVTTTQDFSLTTAPTATLSGSVTDGSGHGWALYAEVKVSSASFGQVADVWTNPATGNYSVSLPSGSSYTVSATAYESGYNPASATVTLASGGTTQNLALTVSSASCTAPGYHFVAGFGQDFNGTTFPPTGWSVTHTPSNSVTWILSSAEPFDNGNYTGGTGTAADADSNDFGSGAGTYDTSLISPPIAMTTLGGATVLKYAANFMVYSTTEALDLGISTDGGTTWTNISHWTTNHGTLYALPGVNVQVDLAAYLPTSGSFQLRWRYYNPSSDYDWYAQIDDVSMGGCVPVAGGLVEGQVTDVGSGIALIGARVSDDTGASAKTFANPADPNLANGLYILFVPPGARTLTATDGQYAPATASLTIADNDFKQQSFALNAPKFTSNPASFTLHVMVNNQVTQTLTIDNIGTGAGVFQILAINAPAPGTAPGAGAGAPLHLIRGHFTPQSIVWVRTHGGATKMLAPRPLSVVPHAGTAAWASIANMPTALMDNAGAADSGTSLVYTLDGTNGTANVNSVYAYDPSADSWSTMANAPTATDSPAAVDINGKIYMANGWDAGGNPTAELDIYDTATDTWTTGTPNPVPAAGGSASAVLNGKMYVVGGCNNGNCASPLTAVQVYDPATDSWSSAANYPQPVTFLMCGGIAGKLYCAGGTASSAYATGYVYDPSADSWSPIANIPVASGTGLWASGYSTAQDKLLVSGGVTGGAVTNAGYAYDSTSDSWSSLPNANDTLYRGAGACGFYRLGGSNGSASVTSAEVLPGYSTCGATKIPWLTVAPTTGTLAVGASANVTLTFDGTNQAEFTTSQAYLQVAGSPYPAPIVPLTVTWDPQPVDLVVSGVSTPSTINKGAEVFYNVTTTNQPQTNHGNATDVKLTLPLPAGTSFVAQFGNNCQVNSGTVSCALGNLALGASSSVTVILKAMQAGTLNANFTATAREPQAPAGDNQTTVVTTVIGTADVKVVSSSGSGAIDSGSKGTVAFIVGNGGPDTATGVAVAAHSVNGILGVMSASSAQGSCSVNAGNVSCNLTDIASGATATVTLTVKGKQAGQGVVTMLVTTSATDPDPSNNVGQAEVTVNLTSGGGGMGLSTLLMLLALALLGVYGRTRIIKRRRQG